MKFTYYLKNNKLLINLIIYIIIFYLLLNSNIILDSISSSTNIFITKLIPALFPYLLITELLITSGKINDISYGLSKILSKIFRVPTIATPCIIIGFLLGYPNSAKYIAKLYDRGQIDSKTSLRLTAFTSNANMSYILVTVGISIFKNISVGIILIISHFLSSIIMGILLPSHFNNSIIQQKNANSNTFSKIYSPFELLYVSIYGTLKTFSLIFAYMVIFSLIPSIILSKITLPKTIQTIVLGIFEISNGINNISTLSLNMNLKIVLASFILSFSSLMILMQIFSFVSKAKVKFMEIVKFKLIQGSLSCFITYIIVTYIYTPTSTVFYNGDEVLINTFKLSPSTFYMLSICIAIFISIILFRKKRQD